MTYMDVKWSVSGVNQSLTIRAVVFVAFLHCACVPVSPVYGVLEHSQGKRVGQISIIHCVSVLTVQVWVSDERNKSQRASSLTAFTVGKNRAITSWQMYLLNVTEMSIRPVELVVSVINCDPVGPLYLGGDDSCFVGSVHSNTTNKGFVSPVCPVYKPNREPRKVL